VIGDQSDTLGLLDGGLSNGEELLGSIGVPSSATYRLAAIDRRGHGRTADTSELLHHRLMADETIVLQEHLSVGPTSLLGWSDGGNVGLLVAMQRPDLVSRLVLVELPSRRFAGARDGSRRTGSGDAGSEYAARSPDGAEHFGLTVEKTPTMFATESTLTEKDLASVKHSDPSARRRAAAEQPT